MIRQTLLDSLTNLKDDVTSVATLSLLAFLAIFFFVRIKPALDSNLRVKRMVRRREEKARADEIFHKNQIRKNYGKPISDQHVNRIYHKLKNTQLSKPQKAFQPKSAKQAKKPAKPVYKKGQGYQAHLKNNAVSISNKHATKHKRFKKLAKRGYNNKPHQSVVYTDKRGQKTMTTFRTEDVRQAFIGPDGRQFTRIGA